MAVRTLPEPGASAQAGEPRGVAIPLGGVVLGLALPLVFLHVDFQPSFTLTLHGVSGNADLSDLAHVQSSSEGSLDITAPTVAAQKRLAKADAHRLKVLDVRVPEAPVLTRG